MGPEDDGTKWPTVQQDSQHFAAEAAHLMKIEVRGQERYHRKLRLFPSESKLRYEALGGVQEMWVMKQKGTQEATL